MLKSFVISTPLGMARAEIELPERLIELWELPALLEPLVAECERLAHDARDASGAAVTCRAGCSACCRQLVTVSAIEAQALAKMIEALDEPRRGELRLRFQQIEAALRSTGLWERLLDVNDPALDAEDHYQLAREYFALQLACPFLENEMCSIYAERPLACREYLVHSPAAHCSRPFALPVQTLAPAAPLAAALALVSARRMRTGGQDVPLSQLAAKTRQDEPEATYDAAALMAQVILAAEALAVDSE